MDKTALLLIGALGGMVFFLTGRSLILERALSKKGGEIKNLKQRILRLEGDKKSLEAALAESRQRTENETKTLRKPDALEPILKKAKPPVLLCVPELTPAMAEMLPKGKGARVIAAKIGNVGKLQFSCATNPAIDVNLAVIGGAAYQADGGKIRRLPDAKKITEGFETLWKSSRVIA